jgi:hypothetical protein
MPATALLTISEAVAQAAESKIGIHEQGGANKGGSLQPFFDADNYDPNGSKPGDGGYAWCAAFVCWCCKVTLAGRAITFKRPATPGAWDFERWCREQDNSVRLKKPHKRDIQRGDIVVFTFSHIGIATGPPDEDGYVPTVEGNTNVAGSREGDGVYRKRRHTSEIRSRIRFY